MTMRLHDRNISNDLQSARNPTPVTGWPLTALARLDREGARGLIADLAMAGMLTRQAAFVVAASVDLDNPTDFLAHLDIDIAGAEGIGLALRTRRARQIFAAVFKVAPNDVPSGYLRAVAKIEEAGSKAPGMDPFDDPASYRRLFEIFRSDPQGRRAHALRYSRKLRASTISAVTHLDPLLFHHEIVSVIGTPQRVAAANDMLDLIRACHATIDEQKLVTAIRQSAASLGTLEVFARKALDTADNLPAPIAAAEGVRTLRTAADYRDLGVRLRNCAATKIAEVALGLLVVVEVTHRAADGTELILAASLSPLSDGRWIVSEVGGVKNRRPPREVMADVLKRLQALGVVVPGPLASGRYNKDLADLLGVYRWAPLDDALHPHGADEEDDVLAALEADINEAA